MIKRKDWMRILCLTHYYNSQVDEDEEIPFYDVPSYKTFNMNFVDYKFRCEKEYKAFIDKYSALPHFLQLRYNSDEDNLDSQGLIDYMYDEDGLRPWLEKDKGYKAFAYLDLCFDGVNHFTYKPYMPSLYFFLLKMLDEKIIVPTKMKEREIKLHYYVFSNIDEDEDDVIGLNGMTEEDMMTIKRAFGFFRNPDYLEEEEENED